MGCIIRISRLQPICTNIIHRRKIVHKTDVLAIPNGCLDAYEVKVNIDIFKYQEKAKLISQFQDFFSFFNGLLEFTSLP